MRSSVGDELREAGGVGAQSFRTVLGSGAWCRQLGPSGRVRVKPALRACRKHPVELLGLRASSWLRSKSPYLGSPTMSTWPVGGGPRIWRVRPVLMVTSSKVAQPEAAERPLTRLMERLASSSSAGNLPGPPQRSPSPPTNLTRGTSMTFALRASRPRRGRRRSCDALGPWRSRSWSCRFGSRCGAWRSSGGPRFPCRAGG